MGRRDSRRDAAQTAFQLLLLSRLYDQYQRLPIQPGQLVTVVAVALIGIHLFPDLVPYETTDVCISSRAMFSLLSESQDTYFALLFKSRRSAFDRWSETIRRLTLSTLLHIDDLHLYYNTAALIWKGSMLEDRMGTARFSLFLGYSILASGTLAVLLGRLAESLELGTLSCAVGFSGVLYAMSAVAYMEPQANEMTLVHGTFVVSRRHAIWLDVVLSSVLHRHVSFLGHLGGALAGWAWCALPRSTWPALFSSGGRGTRFHGGGRVGGSGSRAQARFVAVD